MVTVKIIKLLFRKKVPCKKCPYKLGLIRTLVNPCPLGKKENIQQIVNALQEIQMVMKEIAGQIESGNFTLNDENYEELKRDYLALVITIVDIVDGAAYLFDKKKESGQKNWKDEMEIEQYRKLLMQELEGDIIIEKDNNS